MGIRSFTKNTFKNNTNVKGWSSWGQIKENAKIVGMLFKDIKTTTSEAPPSKKSTFAETVQRLGLTDDALRARMKSHFQVAVACTALGLIAFGWTFYLLIAKGMLLSSLVALSLSALMFSYAFREHFNYFQIKQKRLDCSFSEWLSGFFAKKK